MFVKPEKTLAIIVEFRNITICIFENLAMETKMTHPITKLLTSFAVLIFLTACGNTVNINPGPDGEPDIFEQIKILEKKTACGFNGRGAGGGVGKARGISTRGTDCCDGRYFRRRTAFGFNTR